VDGLVRAKAVGAEHLVLGRTINRVSATAMVEAYDAFLLDVVKTTG
jgi:hypothetical protein